MTEKPRFPIGAAIHVWHAGEYRPDAVAGFHEWTHSSGNIYIAYRLASGLYCSINSIQEFADPDWFAKGA